LEERLTVFIIFGNLRSGTTLLAKTLSQNENIIVPDETDFLVPSAFILDRIKDERYGKRSLAEFIVSTERYKYSIGKYLDPEEVAKCIANAPYTYAEIVTSIYNAIAVKAGKTLAGDKSPNDLAYWQGLADAGVLKRQCKVIHLIRDVRDVILSVRHTGWEDDGFARHFASIWWGANQALNDYMKEFADNYKLIKYEELVLKPRSILKEICEFLDVPFNEAMLDYRKRDASLAIYSHHQNLSKGFMAEKAGAWKNFMFPKFARYVEISSIRGLKHFKYEIRSIRGRIFSLLTIIIDFIQRSFKGSFEGQKIEKSDVHAVNKSLEEGNVHPRRGENGAVAKELEKRDTELDTSAVAKVSKILPRNVVFRCNVCGSECEMPLVSLEREGGMCSSCGSTVRMRSIVRLLSLELFGEALLLPDFPIEKRFNGIGFGDWSTLSTVLEKTFNYQNIVVDYELGVFYDSFDSSICRTLDFIIASDVFEFIPSLEGVNAAFALCHRLLKNDGIMVFTVPFKPSGLTEEYYPDLYKYESIYDNGKWTLKNITRNGEMQIFEKPEFLNPDGTGLVKRLFSENCIIDGFINNGFGTATTRGETDLTFGIYWRNKWSLPIIAVNYFGDPELALNRQTAWSKRTTADVVE
jgi:hypothetical protein